MSIFSGDLLPTGKTLCGQPSYNDNRWTVRPHYYSSGKASDFEWLTNPIQPSYYETDVPDMSNDLNKYTEIVNGRGRLKPEVASDPCYPTPLKYFSFGLASWRYDRNYPSMTIPSQPCIYRGKTSIPDVACLDQQQFENLDRYNQIKPN